MLGLCELRQGFREGTVTADPGAVPEGGGGLPWSGGAWQAAGSGLACLGLSSQRRQGGSLLVAS